MIFWKLVLPFRSTGEIERNRLRRCRKESMKSVFLLVSLDDASSRSCEGFSPRCPFCPKAPQGFTLENGLTWIVEEDHSAPVVSVQVWCATGSIDEGKWMGAGLSHILEHMLFKGTRS